VTRSIAVRPRASLRAPPAGPAAQSADRYRQLASTPSSTLHSPARPSPRGPCCASTRREYYESHSLTARLYLVSPSNPSAIPRGRDQAA